MGRKKTQKGGHMFDLTNDLTGVYLILSNFALSAHPGIIYDIIMYNHILNALKRRASNSRGMVQVLTVVGIMVNGFKESSP